MRFECYQVCDSEYNRWWEVAQYDNDDDIRPSHYHKISTTKRPGIYTLCEQIPLIAVCGCRYL